MQELIDLYTIATKISINNNQTVGDKNNYYITLEQLMDIISKMQ